MVLSWNRVSILRDTVETFKKHHDIADRDIIVVDNGSTDGTQEYLRASSYDLILSRENLGAQAGKLLGCQRAVNRGDDFILFIENDHPCMRRYLLHYRQSARPVPPCFRWQEDDVSRARRESMTWQN